MTGQAAPDVHSALTGVLRADRGRLLSALIVPLRSFDLAEEALSDAVESALLHWGRSGVPAHPQGWLLSVARRKAIDRLRRASRWRDREPDLALLAEAARTRSGEPGADIPDERLRLIFTCCHPALDPKSRVALTLRTLGGLTTAEIARAFLDEEPTMGQRLSRAKAKIAAAGIPYAVPGPDLWDERLNSVLTVLYLIFNEGYAATRGDTQVRLALCDEAIWLARMVMTLRPGEPEVLGLLSLMLTTDARRAARQDAGGRLVPLDRQDRTLWDGAKIGEGLAQLDRAIACARPGGFQIKAAISALHVRAADHAATDFRQIVLLYDALMVHEPSPIVRLNRAVALAEFGEAGDALAAVSALGPELDRYQPYHAALADLLARSGAPAQAEAEYDTAIRLSGTAAERDFLAARKSALATGQKKGRDKARPSPTGR